QGADAGGLERLEALGPHAGETGQLGHGRKINPAQIPRDSPSSAHCDRAACSRATSCARSRSGEARGRHFQLVIRAITPRCAPHRVAPQRSAATLLRTAGKAPVTPRPDGFTMVYIQTPM